MQNQYWGFKVDSSLLFIAYSASRILALSLHSVLCPSSSVTSLLVIYASFSRSHFVCQSVIKGVIVSAQLTVSSQRRNFRILPKFLNFAENSEFCQNFWILPKIQNFTLASFSLFFFRERDLALFIKIRQSTAAGPSGYPNPTRYPVFLLIPDPTRFSFENHRVAGNPKYRVLPDISGKPEVSPNI